jgi:hypothetical protein
MALEIQVLACDRHKNVAGQNVHGIQTFSIKMCMFDVEHYRIIFAFSAINYSNAIIM